MAKPELSRGNSYISLNDNSATASRAPSINFNRFSVTGLTRVSRRFSGSDLRRPETQDGGEDEETPLLASSAILGSSIKSESIGRRLLSAVHLNRQSRSDLQESKEDIIDDRVWYDQFTSTDWVHDSLKDAHRFKSLHLSKGLRGRLTYYFDGSQGWILSALVGFITACIAYVVDTCEATIFDFKHGYCSRKWYLNQSQCCTRGKPCDDWLTWSKVLNVSAFHQEWSELVVYLILVVTFATIACLMTLTTKTTIPSKYRIKTLDENLAGSTSPVPIATNENLRLGQTYINVKPPPPPVAYYSAAGSGVAEVKVILSGFRIHKFLGLKTLVVKTSALIFSVASGLSVGKEGPFVHIAACVGNIAARLFAKYDKNDGKRREILSAAAASGVAVAFGAPIGGVLFSLEEASYFFPAKTLFRTFFCCITAAISLKYLDPFGSKKIVIFEERYRGDWQLFEMPVFILIGVLGGAAGALFIKASALWARSFRQIPSIKKWPLLEVMAVALTTGLVSYWNSITRYPVAELMHNLASPCDETRLEYTVLCPREIEDIPWVLGQLLVGFITKGLLTIITFGIKVPAGIYVPSMVVGGLMGRIVGHLVQLAVLRFPDAGVFGQCAADKSGMSCINPGIYALIAAGATMCGVTRLSVTLAVILFEITGLEYVLPFSLSILVAKWTADALEPLSIYDLLTNMNSYPYLNNKTKPVFTGVLTDIIPRIRAERIIDISSTPLVSAICLRTKLDMLHLAGEIDGGLPIVKNDVLTGLIACPDLEYALDQVGFDSLCLMAGGQVIDDEEYSNPADFTPYIDSSPLALDIGSTMDLVYECFAKLGLRYICLSSEGKYAGLLHRKVFVKYVRELELEQR